MDESKVVAIKSSPKPTFTMEVRSFHRLASVCHWFIKDFSAIMSSLTEGVKKRSFEWTKATKEPFK